MKTDRLIDAHDWDAFERVIVLSPHLDDAALSCAATLLALRGVVSRLVVTIACGNPLPKDAGDGTRRSRTRRGLTHPAQRRREDIAAMHAMDCDFVHLGFSDCVYRRSPTTGDLIYKNARTKWAIPSPEDSAHVEEVFLTLRRLCQNMGRVLVLSPLGIGFHVDHIICAQTALRIASRRVKLLFYEDIPYAIDPSLGSGVRDGPLAALERLGCLATRRYAVRVDPGSKAKIVGSYESQIGPLFGGAKLTERLSVRRFEGEPAELFWKARPFRQESEEST